MARVAIDITVLDPAGNVKAGASVAVKRRADNTAATWYTAETGGSASTAALSTDANGRVSGWVERGAYLLNVSGSGITSVSVPWEAGPAGDSTIDTKWLGNLILPIGVVLPWAGSGDPAGGSYLVADGRLLSRTTFAALYNAIGTAFGAGDGSTTFAIPDLRGRSPVGADLGTGRLSTFNQRGQAAGAATKALAVAELPPHRHQSWVDGGQAAAYSNTQEISPGNVGYLRRYNAVNAPAAETGDTGAGTAFSLMGPYQVMGGFIIRAQ